MTDIRSILSDYVSLPKNLDILEKNLNLFLIQNKEETVEKILYEVIYLLQTKSLKEVNVLIKEGKLGWNGNGWEVERKTQDEKDEFITNPFEVEEGVMECHKCGSKKTYHYQKQIRSSDEGMTTFCFCMNCDNKWRIN